MKRIPAAPKRPPARRDVGPARAPASPTVARALALQRAAGNRAATRVLARRWTAQASKKGGKGIAEGNNKMRKAMSGLIESLDHMAAGPGTMVQGDGYRIDYQGGSSVREGYVNIQVQGGNFSYAGVLCPPTLPLETIHQGLELSLQQGQLMVWEPDEEAEVPDEKPQPKKRQPPKGGGKGGGKGGHYRVPVAVQ